MDHMTEYELVDILNNLQFSDMNDWEQTRLQIYTISQIMSKSKLKPEELISFPWDNLSEKVKQEPLPKTISDEDIARLREKAKQREKLI